jgi:hypothetical protein
VRPPFSSLRFLERMPTATPRILATAGLVMAGSSQAYVAAPTTLQISAAIETGRAFAERHEGYYSADYLIYKSSDTLALDSAGGSVDAVVLGTPLERTRHASFLESYSLKKAAARNLRLEAALPDGWLQIVVFAHGATRMDRDFAKRFGPASLYVGAGTVMPASVDYEGPERAIYPHAVRDAVRYAATIAYKFDLSAMPNIERQTVVFSFSDETGKHFDLPIDLGRYD